VIVHFEDTDLLVVEKPAGMLVHPTGAVRDGTLIDVVASYLGFPPGLPHRLDRETSGLVVLAKTAQSLRALTRHFARRLVEKRYVALVHGRPADAVIRAPIGRDPALRPQWRVLADGRPAETRLTTVSAGERSLVSLVPVTGRTNQLRIHCAHVGHPIVGDDWYGSPESGRLCLHAAAMGLHHPADGRWLEVTSPIPPEILAIASR
jgi:23S rRNA pseudouridine1911/1915/1917 synthase